MNGFEIKDGLRCSEKFPTIGIVVFNAKGPMPCFSGVYPAYEGRRDRASVQGF
jgi:hypothetical protein